ncbi:MAG: hypothetical protein HN370_03890 [Phycisphaerales bacterium]|jgi:hypothetical protein|nr:hypothetical protein [Phycisphaerales bacterium]
MRRAHIPAATKETFGWALLFLVALYFAGLSLASGVLHFPADSTLVRAFWTLWYGLMLVPYAMFGLLVARCGFDHGRARQYKLVVSNVVLLAILHVILHIGVFTLMAFRPAG